MGSEIPLQGRIPFTDIVIDMHWGNHALLMFGVWFVIVPFAVMFLRFGKGRPQTYGIPRGTPLWRQPELCWTLHKRLLYLAIFLALGGVVFAATLTGGVSGTIHSMFGLGAVTLGVLQIVSAWFRGSHGGRKDPKADPDNRATWGGDHFDMTPQRWWFEAWHKTSGYFAIALALGAVATGLAQYWLPWIAVALGAVVFGALILAVVLQGLGYRHDTYMSVYGTHPDHPFNRRRFAQMFAARDEKP
ncbi:MAG: hypothetical protein IT542_07425 [Rubellimicrobium sp.]|nr:hypothetical protein [Rubellimicrobium sp.]